MTEIALNHVADSPLDTDWEYLLRISHSPFGPGIARALVRAVLTRYRADPTVLDNAQLAASELVTNSLADTKDPVAVRLMHAGGRLRLGVWDSGAHPLPEDLGAVRPDLDAESGRGLWLLRSCADEWGQDLPVNPVNPVNGPWASRGKEVWAEWQAPCL